MAGQEHFAIRLDTEKLEQDAQKAKKAFDGIAEEAQKAGKTIDSVFSGKGFSENLEKQFSDISKIAVGAFDGVSDNAQRMIKEIQESTLQLRNVERLMSELNTSYENGAISQNDYINAAARLTVVHEKISNSIRDTEAALKAETTVIDKLADDSMVALQSKVTLLTTSYMKLSKAQRESTEGEKLLKNISEVNAELQRAQVAMSKYGATTTGQFNTLGMSIQQIARELPSLTISPQMFFLAISNNLPIFTDALAQARKEYEAMTAAGQKAVPVWKQVAKSILSWQTAISLLPTLLLLYGDNVVKFFQKFVGGGKKIDYAKASLEAFKNTLQKGQMDAQKEITNLNILYEATQDVSKSVTERKAAVDALQDQYPAYFKNVSDEKILAGEAAEAYDKLSQSIINSAKARAAQEQMVEQQKTVLENVIKINEAYGKLDKAEKDLESAQKFQEKMAGKATADEQRFLSANVEIAKNKVEALEEEIAGYRSAIYLAEKISKELQDSINIEDLLFDPKTGDGGKEAANRLEQYLNELLGIQQDNEERRIELTKQGTEKEIALIELRYQRQIEAVKKLQEELTKAQGGKLTEEQKGVFGTAITGLGAMRDTEVGGVQNKQLEAERKAMQQYLAEYGDYWEKRKAVASKYQDEIAKATTEGERKSLQAEMTKALAKLDDEAQKKTSIIVKLFGDMSQKSVDEMRNIADEAEALLAFIEGGEYTSANAFGITEEQFKILSQSPEKLESIKNEIQNVRNEADKAEPTFERIKNLLQQIFDSGDDNKLEDWLNDLNAEVGKVMQSVGFFADSFAKLGDAFGGGAFSGIADGLNAAMDAVSSAMQGAQAGSLFGPIGAAAGAAVGVVTSLVSSIAQIHDKKKEKEIQQLQEQIDTLSRSYDDLGRAVEKVYSKDASNLIEQQNKLLEQQKVLIQGQIAEERAKKDADEGRIKEWENQLADINNQLEDNKQKAIDVIFGEDVQSAIERFSSAYTDAWAQGKDATEAARNAVKQMMQQMVTESIKAAIQSSKKMEEIRQKLQEFYADNVLTGWEQEYIYNMAEQLQKELDAQFGWAEDLFKPDTSTQEASTKGFATMSQESADELNGRFTALYEVSLRMENQINIGNVNLEAVRNAAVETRDIVQNCFFELVEIRENTGAVVKPIQQMQKDMAEMNKTIKAKL